MSWAQRKQAASPLAAGDPSSDRLEALEREYEQLRQDSRSYWGVMVAMASAAAAIGGTSVFFLLRGSGLDGGSGNSYPAEIYMLLPAPSLCVTALLVQQAVGATIRGRILMAIEVALSQELKQTYRLGSRQVPVHSTYHLQQRVHHDFSGAALWTLMFSLPLLLLIGIIYYSGLELYGFQRPAFYVVYISLVLLIAWTALPVLGGYRRIDSTLGDYLDRRRAEGKFQI